MADTANAVQMLDAVLWMTLTTATEGAGRVQGIRGHFGGPAFYVAAYLSGADHDPASPTRTAPSGTRPSTAHRIMNYGNYRWFPFIAKLSDYEEKDISSLDDSSRKAYQKLLDSLISVRDGALGQHIGWAPVFKSGDSLDLKSSRSRNISSKGSGQMGAIMTDFQWNAMMASMGLASMDAAIWDKPLWDDTGMPFEAPSIRSSELVGLHGLNEETQTTRKR